MTQGEGGSVTRLIADLEAGDRMAATALWDRYFAGLTRLASRHGAGRHAGAVEDEEDAALSAFHSFCQGVARGRFPRLDGREDLWRLLVVITARKVSAQRQRARARKRGGDAQHNSTDINVIMTKELGPEFAAEMAEECRRLLDRLDNDDLRQVAIWRMEGYEREEIARRMGCAVRTVARRLDLIRKTWSAEVAP